MDEPRVAAIVLAAGASTRFGSPKQLLDWRGQPLMRHVIWQALAAPVSEIVVALGAHYARVAPLAHGLPVTLTRNARWEMGLSSSVALGLRALRTKPDAAIFLLADQPGVTSDLIARIIRAYAETGAPIVAPRVGRRRGNPALFASPLFSELMQVTGDRGGRALMARYQDRIAWVDADEWALFDIDEPVDLKSPPLPR
jgi:molybdenum cofactor cytidylyltransferase